MYEIRIYRTKLMILISVAFFIKTPLLHAEDNFSIDKLDRLFTDKNQRYRLDKLRKHEVANGDATDSRDAPLESDGILKINGVVTRGKHAPIVWVNNQRIHGRKNISSQLAVSGVSIRNKQAVVRLRKDNRGINLKSGQFWSDSDQKAHEGYELRAIEKRNDSDLVEHRSDSTSAMEDTVNEIKSTSLLE